MEENIVKLCPIGADFKRSRGLGKGFTCCRTQPWVLGEVRLACGAVQGREGEVKVMTP